MLNPTDIRGESLERKGPKGISTPRVQICATDMRLYISLLAPFQVKT